MPKNLLAAWIKLFLLAFIWGSSFILIKKGLIGLSPQEVGSLRIVSASLLLLPSALMRLKKVPKGRMVYLMASGFLGSLIPAFLFAVAQTQLESAITGVLNGLTPILTILMALFIFRQKQTSKVYLGIAIGFVGTVILVTSGEGSFSGINSYALLVILGTFCYASNLNLIKAKLDKIHPITVTSISLMLVGPIAIVYLLGFTNFIKNIHYVEAAPLSTLYICILGILGTAIALIIFNKILQMTDPLFASSVTYIIPVVAIIWGIIDGEKIHLIQYMGMAAIGLGVYIANTNRASYKKKGSSQ
ncbi:MAG: EamA family transporter [Ekhidna sp.]|nr:EamA family transporter [Ekhidna sp.]MBC6425116.1 EamA family transporter [Ekhidna sp.]